MGAQVLACVLMLKCGPHSHIANTWEVVGTSTRTVACAFASEPQPPPIQTCVLKNKLETKNHGRKLQVHPCCRLYGGKNSLPQQCHCLIIDRGGDREATISSWFCGTGTAKIRCTRHTCQNNVTQVLCLQHAKGEVREANRETHTMKSNRKPLATRPPCVVSRFPHQPVPTLRNTSTRRKKGIRDTWYIRNKCGHREHTCIVQRLHDLADVAASAQLPQ